jgi:ribosomal-protein-alanine N-acetyltransferase
MTFEDINQVLIVEELSFPSPWSRAALEFEMNGNEHAHYFVVEIDGEIVAYCGAWFVMDQGTITNIAVNPAFRGRKIGETIFNHVLMFARESGISEISLEVRVSNVTAQGLYRKYGFSDGGIRKNYYVDNHEDARVMFRSLMNYEGSEVSK